MSNNVLNQCWPLKMPPTAKLVLISMADQADDDGRCWPSIQHLSDRTCVSKRAVIDAIKWLESSAVLIADRSNGRHTRYQIKPAVFVPSGVRSPRTQGRATSADAAPTSADAAPVPVQMPHQPVQMPHTNPQEPPLEPSITPTPRVKRGASDLPDGFAEFWAEYPRKDAKPRAVKAWTGKRLDADRALREKVMAGLARWRKHDQWIKDSGTFAIRVILGCPCNRAL